MTENNLISPDLLRRCLSYEPVHFAHLGREAWFHRPFTPEELEAHPERESIIAAVEAVAERMLDGAIATAEALTDFHHNGEDEEKTMARPDPCAGCQGEADDRSPRNGSEAPSRRRPR